MAWTNSCVAQDKRRPGAARNTCGNLKPVAVLRASRKLQDQVIAVIKLPAGKNVAYQFDCQFIESKWEN